ncbi:hypothetical protein [Pseudodesulfovibrio portus]|uniref:Uncharacterized protein n=1 Tax=Pseudodesulfovibrio portus TaxID=231439 RepID=A0ABN6RNQ8_9BACT|nr:hypothetical protein [Pseudodesulfovibrio portus]BDQ32469.1 hypothetical protein JCM14722_00110 [Pseudodesulfovibrio portus]
MQITDQTAPLFYPETRDARSLVRTFTPTDMTLEPEKTDEELRLESSTFSFQRQLSPEEENRVLFLQNLLAQMLAMADGQPIEEQRSRIRDIEKELEKITGVKVRSSLSAMTKDLPGKQDEDEEENLGVDGIDPKEAAHKRRPDYSDSDNPGMQMLQCSASFFKLSSLLDSTGDLKSISSAAS